MRWADAHRIAMLAAFQAHEDFVSDTMHHVEVFDAMVRAGLKVLFRPLDCAALYLPPAVANRPGALVNASHPLSRQRYSAAHELGHHVFQHGSQVDQESEPRGSGTRLAPEEMLAEAFASWFLMPPEAIEGGLVILDLNAARTPAHAYALSLRLGTSFRATCNHVTDLQPFRDTPVKGLKEDLIAAAPPGGWRHDVWCLTARDAAVTIKPRCGDVLLVDLPGWDIEAVPAGATAELVPPLNLLVPPRWRIDLPPDLPAGSATLLVRQPGSTLEFTLDLQRPRFGRYVSQ